MVALGTSAPELVVNLLAASRGNVDFALANVSGSNLANLCLGFGFCGILGGLRIRRREFGRDALVLVGTPVLIWVMFGLTPSESLPYLTTIPLTIIIVAYFYSLYKRSNDTDDDDPLSSRDELGKAIGIFIGGSAALYFGGELVLKAAIEGAKKLHIGTDIIALTVVALGTSVPDITASVVATIRKEYDIAIGNILGSNISNIGLVLNGTLLVHCCELPTTPQVRMDYLVVCLISAVICGIVFSTEKITRRLGGVLIGTYCVYLVFRVLTTPAVSAMTAPLLP
jgi:cation:H+ antiporter